MSYNFLLWRKSYETVRPAELQFQKPRLVDMFEQEVNHVPLHSPIEWKFDDDAVNNNVSVSAFTD